jgi:hypothetical protein
VQSDSLGYGDQVDRTPEAGGDHGYGEARHDEVARESTGSSDSRRPERPRKAPSSSAAQARFQRSDRAGGRTSDRDGRASDRYSDRRPAGGAQRPTSVPRDAAVDYRDRPSAVRAGAPLVRHNEPVLPDGVTGDELDPSVRAQLRGLEKDNAAMVAAHLVAAGELLDDDPQAALEHARAARNRAPRVAATREALGIAAYHAGEWSEARMELRTARRITGDAIHLPVLADCERALGHPDRALKLLEDPDVARLDPASRVELIIVAAGARRDLGQPEAALQLLSREGLDPARPGPGGSRLFYAYADTLETLGRNEEAVTWFAAAANHDPDDETGAAERLGSLLED